MILQGINASSEPSYATAWNNVNFSVKGNSILDNVWGYVSRHGINDSRNRITRWKLSSYDFVSIGTLREGGGYHGSVRGWKVKSAKRFGW